MRRNIAIGVVLVLLLGLVVWWRFPRGGGDDDPKQATATGSATAGSAQRAGKQAPATKVTLSGRITRAAGGAGVAGAVVSLNPKRSVSAMFDRGRGDRDEASPIATADADGRWSLKDVEPGTYVVGATGKALLPGSREVTVASTNVDGIDLALDAGGAIASGTVSDVLGGPIPGAKVVAERNRNNPFASSPDLVTFTDDKGAYQLALPPGTFSFQASHEAYTKGMRYLEMTADPVTIDFTLTPGASIRGQVVTTDGTPVADAVVIASAGIMGRAMGGFGGEGDYSDEQGHFTLKSLAPGALSLSARGGGYSTVTPTVVELGIGEQVDGVRIVVEKGFTISGRVVEKGTTKGIAGVRVGVFSIGSGEFGYSREPSTDEGAFVVQGVRPASYMMFALGDDVMPEIGKPVEIVDKDVKDVVVEMAAGVTISGRVEPPGVANVSISPTAIGFGNMFDAMKAMMVRGESDATGAFTLKHAPPGSFTLRAETAEGRAGSTPLVVEQVDKTGVVVKLEKRASIAGKVIDASGAAVTDVEVHARPLQRDKGMTVRFSMDQEGESNGRVRQDGTFLLVGLAGGKYGLTVSDSRGRVAWASPANKDKPSAPIEIELANAADKTGVTLTIEMRDGAIKGVVVLPDGKPAADTWVTATMERASPKLDDATKRPSGEDMELDRDEMRARFMSAGGYAPVLTNAEGRFSIEKLRRGSYKLVGENAKGSARGQKDGVKTGETVTLQLGRLGTLTGKVTVNGAPATPYDIACTPAARAGLPHEKRVTDKSGVYTLERLPPGDYACDATGEAGKASDVTVTVPAGDATLDLALVPWASLTGTVVSVLSGEPIAGVKPMTSSGGMDRQAITEMLGGKGPTSDAKGAFTIGRVAPGKGSLVVMPATGGFTPLATKAYEAKAGQKLDLGAIKIVPPRTGEAGTIGIGTDTENAMLTVADVKAGGPAEAMGVKVGDRIVTINGVDVATLTPEVGQSLLASGSIAVGQKFVLGIDRGGTVQQVTTIAIKW